MSDLATLFATDPLKLEKTDIAKIVDEMRKSRHLFNSAPKVAKAPKTSAASAAGVSLDLSDLGI